MEGEGPQSEGTGTADLMDYMDSDSGDSETSNDGSQGVDAGSQPDTPQQSADQGHPREDQADEFDEELADEPVAGTPQAEAPSATPSYEPTTPFKYSVGQQTHDFGEGAVMGADGVLYIDKDVVPEVQRLISRGRYFEEFYPRERQQWERRVRDAETRFNEKTVRAEASAKFFDDLVEKGPEKIVEFLSNWQMNKPQIMASQQAALAKAYYEQAQQLQRGDPQENEYRTQEFKQQAITSQVQALQSDQRFGFMQPEDWGQFQKRLQRNQGQLFTVADRDYGPHETSNGIPVQRGQLALNTAWLNDELAEFATMVQHARQQRQQVSNAQAFNRRQQGNGRRQPPQSGATTRTGAPRDAQSGRFKSGKDWRDHLMDQMGMVSATPEADG